MNKNYWLYVEPHVYCNSKHGQIILYNTKSTNYLESADEKIVALVQELYQKQNLGALFFDGVKLTEEPYKSFITEFCEKGMGGLVDSAHEKPIQLMPALNLQRDVEKLKMERERSSGENVLHYLLQLNLYINQECSQQCLHCNTYFQQQLCCAKAHTKKDVLSVPTLQSVFNQIKYSSAGRINILGGNILTYPDRNELRNLLHNDERVYLWLHYIHIAESSEIISGFKYDIPVTFPLNELAFESCSEKMKDEKTCYHFFILNENEYEQTEKLIEKYAIANYNIHPIYVKENLRFFEENIYMNKDDLFTTSLSFRQIFAHQKLNTNFFGSLTILPNGDVYANVNSQPLGNIHSNSVLHLIDEEMSNNTAWRTIRDKKPCAECLYQFLCPSPSNYETAIGKFNLCNIK